jgi:hypothetical protein
MTEQPQPRRTRDKNLSLWVSQEGWDAIERARGTWTRSEYLRQALKLAQKEGLKGPRTGGVEF